MRLLFAPLLAFAFLLACGGSGDDDASPTLSGPPVSDEEYVVAICNGIDGYLGAVLSKGDEEIRDAVRAFVDTMNATNPPTDAREFHTEFVEYIEQGLDDPTILLTAPAPQPRQDVKERLGAVETRTQACEYPLFSREGLGPSPTPGG